MKTYTEEQLTTAIKIALLITVKLTGDREDDGNVIEDGTELIKGMIDKQT